MGVVTLTASRARKRATITKMQQLVDVRDEPLAARRDQRVKLLSRGGRGAFHAYAAAERPSRLPMCVSV